MRSKDETAGVAPEQVVGEARSWLGTPFHHQGRLKGVGCDCAGLVVGVARALGLAVADERAYGRIPSGLGMLRACRARLAEIPADEAGPGDVLLLSWGGAAPHHLAIVTPLGRELGIVHCAEQVGGVVEHRLDAAWRARIRGAFRLPGLAAGNLSAEAREGEG